MPSLVACCTTSSLAGERFTRHKASEVARPLSGAGLDGCGEEAGVHTKSNPKVSPGCRVIRVADSEQELRAF